MSKWLLVLSVVFAMAGIAQATVFFSDDFESYTVGQALTPPQSPTAPVGGYYDYRYTTAGVWSNTAVVDTPVLGGSKALKIFGTMVPLKRG